MVLRSPFSPLFCVVLIHPHINLIRTTTKSKREEAIPPESREGENSTTTRERRKGAPPKGGAAPNKEGPLPKKEGRQHQRKEKGRETAPPPEREEEESNNSLEKGRHFLGVALLLLGCVVFPLGQCGLFPPPLGWHCFPPVILCLCPKEIDIVDVYVRMGRRKENTTTQTKDGRKQHSKGGRKAAPHTKRKR